MVNPSTTEAKEEPPNTITGELRFDIREEFVGGYKKPTDDELIAKEQEFISELQQKELEDKYRIVEAEVVKSKRGVILEKTPNRLGGNCVKFVRSKKPNMPQPMSSLSDKKNIINSDKPKLGAVAITREGPVGHVAIVVDILDETLIIEEGNYSHGYKTLRMIPKNLPLGFWVS